MRKAVFTILMIFTVVLAGCSETTSEESAGKEEITVYTALEEQQISAYLEAFNKKHPSIKVNIVRDSTGVITAKLLAERDNPKADAVWGVAATSLLAAKEDGLLQGYAPKGIERIKPQFKDEGKQPEWVGIDAWMTAFSVNTVELEKKGLPIPKSYEDLLNPEYKELISMPAPASSGTGFLTVSALIQQMGDEKAWEYMEGLHNNIGIYTHSGSKPAKLAAQGEYPIGISFGYPSMQEQVRGAPIKTVFPEEGSGWEMEANALVKKDNIKPEAKTFLDWAISKDAMNQYAENFAITAAENDLPTPTGYPEKPESQLIENDFDWAMKNRPEIIERWSSRFEGKSEPSEM